MGPSTAKSFAPYYIIDIAPSQVSSATPPYSFGTGMGFFTSLYLGS